jgi:hypothetical protein
MVSNDDDRRRQEQSIDKKANSIGNESIGENRELRGAREVVLVDRALSLYPNLSEIQDPSSRLEYRFFLEIESSGPSGPGTHYLVILVLHACDSDPRVLDLLPETSPCGVFVTRVLQFQGPRSSLGRDLNVQAPQSQKGGNSGEQSIRPVMIPRGFVRHVADTMKFGSARRASQQEGTVLEHSTPPPSLRAADNFDAIGYDIFRIGGSKA